MQFSLCSPLPGQTVKLFFSSSPKALSLKFDSAPVHRGRFQHHYPGKAPEGPARLHIQIQMFQMIC